MACGILYSINIKTSNFPSHTWTTEVTRLKRSLAAPLSSSPTARLPYTSDSSLMGGVILTGTSLTISGGEPTMRSKQRGWFDSSFVECFSVFVTMQKIVLVGYWNMPDPDEGWGFVEGTIDRAFYGSGGSSNGIFSVI